MCQICGKDIALLLHRLKFILLASLSLRKQCDFCQRDIVLLLLSFLGFVQARPKQSTYFLASS